MKDEMIKYVEGIKEELVSIYEGNTMNDEGEEVSFYDYLSDVLDYEFLIDSNREYKGSKLYVTLGGPTVWIDTTDNTIKIHWGTDSCSVWLPSEIADEIDLIMSEFYNC